jgi:integrase
MEKDINGGGTAAAKTYSALKIHFEQTVGAALGIQQRRNQLSALSQYQIYHGRADSDLVGPELNGSFEQHLTAFLALRDNPGTAGNLKTLLRGWKGTYEDLLARELPFTSFFEAINHYFDCASATDPSVTVRSIAAKIGAPRTTLHHWLKLSIVVKLEVILAAPKGALTRFVHDRKILCQQASEKICSTAYGKRSAALTAKPLSLPKDRFSLGLCDDWKGYLQYKLAVVVLDVERKHSWRLRPQSEYQGSAWLFPFLSPDGENFSSSAQIKFEGLRRFFGVLASIETAPGTPKYNPEHFSLAWLADFNLVSEVVKYLAARYGAYTTTISQLPEFGKRLLNEVGEAEWPNWCEQQSTSLKKITTQLADGKHFVQTRDPYGPIWDYIQRQHPITALFELAQNMSRYLVEHPLLCEKERITLERDLFMIQLLTEQPLRIKMLSIMIYKADNTGNLYQRADGTYALRFDRKDFKNERGAAKKNYDVAFRPSFTAKIDRYLKKVLPLFGDSRPLVFVAFDSGMRQTNVRTASLQNAFRKRTRQFLPGCVGFGPHSVRHLLATDYIKNHESGWQTAADVLHDTLVTVMKAYAFIKAEDGHKFFQRYLAELEETWNKEK